MSSESTSGSGGVSVDQASIRDAYLDIPDEANPPIIDARKTFLITVVGAVLFIAAVLIFIL